MGTWGKDIFDSDTALDVLGDVTEHLKQVIERDLRSMKCKSGRTGTTRETPPALAILTRIAVSFPNARCHVTKREVERWRKEFFDWYHVWFAPSVDAKDWKEYKRKIANDFRRLENIVVFDDEP